MSRPNQDTDKRVSARIVLRNKINKNIEKKMYAKIIDFSNNEVMIARLEAMRKKWINQYYHNEKHIDVTECADELGVWLEDLEELEQEQE